jgi:hypothetical protein
MRNIASYQEGYTDGYADGIKNNLDYVVGQLKNFYNDNYESDILDPFLRGYNLALNQMLETLTDIVNKTETN